MTVHLPNLLQAPTSSSDSPEALSRREQLYDQYLDAVLAGICETPVAFLTAHQATDEVLRQQLEAVHAASINGERESHAEACLHDDSLPRQFGEFRLLRRLGEGGMGVVFLAEQTALRRQVALKVIRPEFSKSATAALRFEREARAIARLRHPNIVSVYAVGEHKSVRFIAMELISGRGLDELLKDALQEGRAISTSTVLRWIAELAQALEYAHSQGIVHRDIKPSNIRITLPHATAPHGRALLVDFGLARDVSVDADAATLTEAFVGSPLYVAPEQVARRGGSVDGRADVYSLGVVLYQCLSGRVPFAEGSLEQVLHQILSEDPPLLRSLKSALPRDLEVVVHKAMEKQAEDRYASAALFAADLIALLEFRPISARPPGLILRTVKWARRNVAAASAAVTAAVAVLTLLGVLTAQHFAARQQQQREALAALHKAEALVGNYRESQAKTHALEEQFEHLRRQAGARHFSDTEDQLLDSAEDQIVALRKAREHDSYVALDLLSRAERLDAPIEDVQRVRAELYLARYLEANLLSNAVDASMYRELVRQNDPHGTYNEDLTGGSTVALTSEPAGASVYLFRLADFAEVAAARAGAGDVGREALHEHRLVPVPILDSPLPIMPGSYTLRIHRPLNELRENDLIVQLAGRPIDQHSQSIAEAGDVDAKVWHDGKLIDMRLPAGLEVRFTAAPLIVCPEAFAAPTPISNLQLDGGDYIALFQAEGFADQRVALRVTRGAKVNHHVALHTPASKPNGFIAIQSPSLALEDPHRELWMMEHEVTVREYFEFLNDPATLAEIDASPTAIYVPRSVSEDIHAPRGSDGRYRLPDEWSWDWPILGISWHDAQAFAQWKTQRARAEGRDELYELPTLDIWVNAASPSIGCQYVFGSRVRAKWISSCFAQARPSPQPVMSYPIDESRLGFYDMTGSVSEWLTTFWQEERGTYQHSGGSWAHGLSEMFHVYGGNGLPPNRFSDTVGFRLIMRRGKPQP